MAEVDSTLREMLIRMEGKIDVITNDNKRTNEDVRLLRSQHHDMNNRIAVVEANHHESVGEKRGFQNSLKAIYALCTITGLSALATAAKALIH